ncbi:hypothetical protein M9H77_31326 [Catharanthus roseus]|uniref:Uncharacterized protein n=1 Tax=Catharanthus roseus TaxID=4058 RepID=A0ACC0A0K4_CATRO|nr:hypothetical protein M9H77_31326 [Catharanthus roseus]
MCCSFSKTDPFFTLSPTVPAPSVRTRSDQLPIISFPTHSPSLNSLKSRVSSRSGCRFGSFSAKSVLEDTVSIADPCSFYELLGIPETGTLLDIKQAYKQLARKYHPDVSPPDRVEEYTQRFIQVQEAYETLSDPNRRALYDSDMARGIHLAFGARKRYQNQNDDEQMVEKGEWRSRSQAQVAELKRRSAYRDIDNNSWGARMRRRNAASS